MTTKHIDMELGAALESLQTSEQPHAFVSNVATEAQAEIARLQAQVADAQRETESLRERLFGALKTDEVLASALQEVDHALDLRRSTLSAVMDVACVQKARADSLQAQLDALADVAEKYLEWVKPMIKDPGMVAIERAAIAALDATGR